MKIKQITVILGLVLSFNAIIPTINSHASSQISNNTSSKTVVYVPSKFNTQDEFDAFVVALNDAQRARKGIHFVKNSNTKPNIQNETNKEVNEPNKIDQTNVKANTEQINTVPENTQINNIPEVEDKANHNFDSNLYYKMRNQVREENGVATLQVSDKLVDFATEKVKRQAQYYKETKILSHTPYGDDNFVYFRTFAKGEAGEITTVVNINLANGENEKRAIQKFIKSNEHNRISLTKDLRYTGVAYAIVDENNIVVTEVFAEEIN